MPATTKIERFSGGVREVFPSGIVQETWEPARKDGLIRALIMPDGERTETYTDGKILIKKEQK